jgi:glycine C-acetyltransferase
MASIGAFIAADAPIIDHLKYNVRSQIFAKSLPMPIVIGNLKRLELLKKHPELKDKLWEIVNAIQNGLKEKGFNIGTTESPVTPVFLNGDTYEAANMVRDLRTNFNIFCSMIVYPVVPKGVIMLRIIPTASHNLDDVQETIKAFEAIKGKLDSGIYKKAGEKGATVTLEPSI